MRKLHSDEEKGLLMLYHSINIEKLPKRIKNNFHILHIKLDVALELILKELFLKSPTLLKVITEMNQTLEGYTLRFWKNIFRPKYTDVVKTVQSYRIYRYVATSAKQLLCCQCKHPLRLMVNDYHYTISDR